MAENQEDNKPNVGKELLVKAAQGVVSSSQLPTLGSGFEIYNINPKYSALVKNFRSRIFTLMKAVLENGGYALSANTRLEDVGELTPCTEFLLDRAVGEMDLHENSDQKYNVDIRGPDGTIHKANDAISEKMGGRYATLLGDPKNKAAAQEERRATTKPQLIFKQFIVNDDAPFVPKLRFKHHDLKQKAHAGQTLTSDNQKKEWLSDLDTAQQHPYEFEILNFKVPERQLTSNASPSFKTLEETPLTLIETIDSLKKLVEKLNNVTEFAVDVEHHEYRTFLGLTCLIQISTRDEDFVIDPFPIWDSVHLLNEPFTDPKILKVFHGADSDVIWLQRDFGIYVVNMLDTYVFMRLLEKPKRSLQVLVSEYCKVDLDKFYQRADWRVRPLDANHLTYARSDTHYLLYCCDRLCQEIKQHNKLTLLDVYNASKQVCLKRFEQPRFNPEGFLALMEKSRRVLNNRQMQALERLWKWRDQIARIEDESHSYVLPDHMLYQIAETLPREVTGVLACCSPIPPLVKRDVFLIHRFIKEARDLPLEEKTNIFDTELGESRMLDAVRRQQQKSNQYTKEFSRLDCRFDQSEFKVDDSRPQIESRFKQLFGEEIQMASSSNRNVTPILPFQPLLPRQQTAKKRRLVETIMASSKDWATPYDSYLVEMMASQKEEEPEQKRAKLVHSTTEAKR